MDRIKDEKKSLEKRDSEKRPYSKPCIEEEAEFDVLAAGCNEPSSRAGCSSPQNTP